MLKFKNTCFTFLHTFPLLHKFSSADNNTISLCPSISMPTKFPKLFNGRARNTHCLARRRVRYNEGEDDEEYGYNTEIAVLEEYSILASDEVLFVRATVDKQEVQVLVYKGFSSCLSDETSPDPSKSVLPARAVIESIDRIKGPFDPSNIYFLEKGLTWDTFKARLRPN